jgi:acyl-CoA thioester hydrolase
VPAVYTAQVTVRHDELDRFGRLQPAVYLRYLAHAAVEASAAAGFDAAWYAAAGGVWLVRRSALAVTHPATTDERLGIRTWVEDFRRVRSHRCYEMYGTADALCATARTDWVYVDAGSGRPRRVPAEIEAAFGTTGRAQERDAWTGPPPPPAPARATHRVRLHEIDTFGHVNNAVYLDVAAQAMFDALADAGWPLDRLVDDGGVPVLAAADLEYLEGARYGERLEIATWFTLGPDVLDAHHHIGLAGRARPLVRATTRWRWAAVASGLRLGLPGGVVDALRPLLAA